MTDPELQDELDTGILGFAQDTLGLSLYDWQGEGLVPLEYATGAGAPLIKISIVTPNGSGKDDRIIPSAAYWWLAMHKRGRVVISSKSDLQLSQQTIPALDKHWSKLGWRQPIQSPRYELTTPTGGKLIAFVTNDPSRIEGWHKGDDIDEPLLLILNEAKSIGELDFQAWDRCTPNAILMVSSPGLMFGRFYETHSKLRHEWICVKAGLLDCPHIPESKRQHIISTYGPDHPLTRSALYGEFMSQDDETRWCVPLRSLIECIDSPPKWTPGFRYLFLDFAEGRAENVACLRDGNKYTIEDAWRETSEDAVVGKCIYHFRRLNLKPEQIGGDAAAKSILDKLAQAGWTINRQNFGAPDPMGVYKSWSAKAWIEAGTKITAREIIPPDDEKTKAQLTSRKKLFLPNGKLAIEDKLLMKKERNLASPDRADAFVGAVAAMDLSLFETKPFDISGWREWEDGREQKDLMESFGAGGCI